MKSMINQGVKPVDSHSVGEGPRRKSWSLVEKLLLELKK